MASEDFRTLLLNVSLISDDLRGMDAGVVVAKSGSEW